MTTDRMEVQRTIDAAPDEIFTLLCDPQGHVDIDSSGMLLDATGDAVGAVDDTFVVHMDREALNDYPLGKYDVTVRITCIAKTVADCFKYRNKIGLDVALEALREAWHEKRMTSDDLWRYAKVCRVANVMRPYLDSLS